MALIVENQYFPPILLFKTSKGFKDVKFEQYENFQKASFRNRCIIAGSNGLAMLTVPVAGGREQKVPVREVRIDYSQPWVRTHLRSLASAYSNSPFYPYYSEQIEALLNSKEKFLFDLNLKINQFLFKILQIDAVLGFTDKFDLHYPKAVDFRNELLPKNFQENKDNWEPRYTQVFQDRWGFQPNLSILDLLFNVGPGASNLL
jgi:hypothetical protein